jgi:hypothetical protein
LSVSQASTPYQKEPFLNSKALGLRTPGIYGIPCENVGFILDKAVDLFKSESKSTTDI